MGCVQSTIASVAVADPDGGRAEVYKGSACPLNEPARLAHLQGLGILDTVSCPPAAGAAAAAGLRAWGSTRGAAARGAAPAPAKAAELPCF